MLIRSQWLSMGVVLAAVAARPSVAAELRDLYFGEALYGAYQGQYFDALERLDAELAQHRRVDEPELDSLQYHIRQADFSVGDFELRYRMHLRAGRAIKAVLDADVEQPSRTRRAYNGWRVSSSRRISPRTRCIRWSGFRGQSRTTSRTIWNSSVPMFTWLSGGRRTRWRCSSACRARRA